MQKQTIKKMFPSNHLDLLKMFLRYFRKEQQHRLNIGTENNWLILSRREEQCSTMLLFLPGGHHNDTKSSSETTDVNDGVISSPNACKFVNLKLMMGSILNSLEVDKARCC